VSKIIQLNSIKKSTSQPLEKLKSLLRDDLELVNQTVIQNMQSPVSLIPELASHIVLAGGKRLRPLLTLAASKMCGYSGSRHINLATCVEFIHTATLLHDDVVDESSLRRGQSSANNLWGNQPSVLVGDFLFSRAFELMVSDGSLKVLKILSNASSIIAEGEVHQIMTTGNIETSEAQYIQVIRSKTAELFAAATRIGAVVASKSEVEEEALQVYGLNLGIAFQLIDDVLDYSAKQRELGKEIGNDFKTGKITLPVILSYRRSNEKERKYLKKCLSDMSQDKNDLEETITIMEKNKSLKDTVSRAEHYGNVARDALGIFPHSDIKEALNDTIDFCINRAY
jgi:octaprenyl-diphosphate synthase